MLNRNAPGRGVSDRHAEAEAPGRRLAGASGRHRAADLGPVSVSLPHRGAATARHRASDGTVPARFSDVLAVGEFRTIYLAGVLSWIGDFAARAAVTALVLTATDSVVAAAAAFAISFAPWLLGGQLLVSLAERYPYRTVMVICDIARMLLMALVAIPGLPLPLVLVLLLGSALFSPPFDAARSATLPAVLPGDKYVVAVALNAATNQPVQVAGYLAGSTLAAINPRTALLINAATFGVSALMLRFGVRHRAAALTPDRRTHLLRETVDGFRLVFGTRALRTPVLLTFVAAAVAIVPQGLGAPWAAQISPGSPDGLAQGLIMAGVPFGSIFGSLLISRLIRPELRTRVLGLLAIAAPVPLIFAAVDTPIAVAVLAALTGFAVGGLVPVANGAFVSVLPNEYRARAFGVVSGGLQLVQGFAVLFTGLVGAHAVPIGMAVSFWCLGGLLLMLALVHPWTRSMRSVTARTPIPAAVPGTMEP